MEEAYTSFAMVYDMFMDNIPYKEWCAYLTGLLQEEGISDGLVLDLGCGTGSATEILAENGYDMIGVDYSEEMLEIAMEKRAESGLDILYLQQDMREFELYGTVRAVVSICDSMNYILEYQDLVQVIRLANLYLDPGGVFIFDMNTEYKYRTVLGQSTIAENREESSFIWENFYDEEERINEYDLTLFIREDKVCGTEGKTEGKKYLRFQETHYQRAYSLDEVICAIKEAGMEFVAAYDAFTREPVRENSERMYIIAREQGKSKTNN
ncbi:MAG: methyltransferase domain-containing protein [bacterium]|nr:methyltransferase domain-containing protein [bacterium]